MRIGEKFLAANLRMKYLSFLTMINSYLSLQMENDLHLTLYDSESHLIVIIANPIKEGL